MYWKVCKFDIPKIPPKTTERKSQKPRSQDQTKNKKSAPKKEKIAHHTKATKHTSGPDLRGPRLLSFAFVRLPSSRWKSQSDQHVTNMWSTLTSILFRTMPSWQKNPWHTMTIYGIITLTISSASLGQICCTMMHHVAYQSMPLQL